MIDGEVEEVALPEPRRDGLVSLERALQHRRSVRLFAPEPLALQAVSQLLWAAQGATAKVARHHGNRSAPSAGALYPLELYLLAGDVSHLQPGLYRYDPQRHRLLWLSSEDLRISIADAACHQDWAAHAPALLVLAAVAARTAQKYGNRTARYVSMETGHAAQNVYLQATALGLGTTVIGAFDDAKLARVLGLPGEIAPLAVLPVGRPR
jgi:SagB-type dehydrogenase family enzyme